MNEEKAKEIEAQIIQQQITELQEQISVLSQKVEEINIVKDAINELKGQKDKEILVPVGNGIFAKAVLKDDENLILNIGANVMVERKREEVNELLDEQIKELNNAIETLQKEFEKLIS